MLNTDWTPYRIDEKCAKCGIALTNRIIDRPGGHPAYCFPCGMEHHFHFEDPRRDTSWHTWKPQVQYWSLYDWWMIFRYRADRAAGINSPTPAPLDYLAPIPARESIAKMSAMLDEAISRREAPCPK